MAMSMLIAAFLGSLLIMPIGGGAQREARSLCRATEAVIFECRAGTKMIAVCGKRGGPAGKSAQYRFGNPGKLELTYPRDGATAGFLSYATAPYSGGGESQISFARGAHVYVVYERTQRTSFGADGRHDPKFEAGVFVKRRGKLLSSRKCTTPHDATINSTLAREFMKEEGRFVRQ